jgi:hypothetical protein
MAPINNSNTTEINRGIELMLRNRREKEISKTNEKKIFSFCKTVSLLKREIKIEFNFTVK